MNAVEAAKVTAMAKANGFNPVVVATSTAIGIMTATTGVLLMMPAVPPERPRTAMSWRW